MAKRSTSPRPAEPPAPIRLDSFREHYLASFAWPAETPDAAKALALDAVTGFAAQLVAHAADLVRPAVVEAPDGMVTVVVTGPREGRYRCGRYFTEVTSAPFAVSAEDYERLKADPKLMVMPAG